MGTSNFYYMIEPLRFGVHGIPQLLQGGKETVMDLHHRRNVHHCWEATNYIRAFLLRNNSCPYVSLLLWLLLTWSLG